MKHVLILGGGFAGVQAAIDLQRTRRFSVTLVSDRDYLYLFPISIWVPTRAMSFEKTKVPLEDIRRAHGFTVVIDRVAEIRTAQKIVRTEHRELSYDYLIIAIGAEKLIPPGHENTVSICGKPEMSLQIRDRLDELVATGKGRIAVGFGGNPKDKSAVRGGPAFEFMFNIEHYLKKKGIRRNFELTFFAPMASPGERMGMRAVQMVDKMFTSLGVQKRFGTKISAFRPGAVAFEDGSVLEADLIMFIPANAGPAMLQHTDLPLTDAGFIRVDDTCLVNGTTNVYAAGDAAALEGPEWRAKQGHLAEVMARNAVRNILWTEDGSTRREGYRRHLNILCVMDTGSGAAVVYRDDKRQIVIPMPVVGHWMKMAWGVYARLTKTGKMIRFPGM
jgi:sulfide:quinone oxidoreductase